MPDPQPHQVVARELLAGQSIAVCFTFPKDIGTM
jgi:hypothetical protein